MAQKTPYNTLKNRWVAKHAEAQKNLWQKHAETLSWMGDKAKHLAVGSFGSLMLVTASPSAATIMPNQPTITQPVQENSIDKNTFLITDLSHVLPKNVRSLSRTEEDIIGETLSRHFGIRVAAELDGKRLNRSYGYIGAEQHLARFPGDTIDTHFDTSEEAGRFTGSGMAPGLGAWGYFAPSKEALTPKEDLREKYYIAVQTFLAPDFSKRVGEYRDFFKYRKMLVVNPYTGRAVVAVIGDAGPAEWTGKHLGGSPEVMKYLQRVDGQGKGPVLYFFVNDPYDQVPLGPVAVQ